MNQAPAPERLTVAQLLNTQAANTQAPAWFRIACWSWSHANTLGHARAFTGQIAQALDLTPVEVSRALAQARARRVIDPCSTAACVVLPGHALAPCDARHRGGV